MSKPADELVIHTELAGSELVMRPLAPLYGAIASLLGALPSYKDSARGRKGAKQLRIILVVVGFFVMLAARHVWPMIILGIVLMASAIVVPMDAVRQRSLVSRWQKKRAFNRATTRPAKLVHDGRRLMLFDGEEQDRRVLTSRPFRLTRFAGSDADTWVELAPKKSKKKREAIWLHLHDLAPPAGALPVKSFRVDAPVKLSAASATPLLARLDAANKDY